MKWIEKIEACIDQYMEDQKYTSVIKHCRKFLKKKPLSAYIWACLGFAQKASGDIQGSMKSYMQSLAIDPDQSDLWYNLSLAYLDISDSLKAIEALNKAIELNPEDEVFFYNRGLVYFGIEEYALSIEDYKVAVELCPDYFEAWFNLGMAYNRKRDFQNAVFAARHAAQIKPDDAPTWSNIGFYLLSQNSKDIEAVKIFEKSIQLDGSSYKAYFGLGNAKAHLKDYQGAIEAYKRTIRLHKSHKTAWLNLGIVYRLTGAYNAAIRALKVAASFPSEANFAMCYLALAYLDAKKYEEALKASQVSMLQQTEWKKYLFAHKLNAGLALLLLGEREKAETEFLNATNFFRYGLESKKYIRIHVMPKFKEILEKNPNDEFIKKMINKIKMSAELSKPRKNKEGNQDENS